MQTAIFEAKSCYQIRIISSKTSRKSNNKHTCTFVVITVVISCSVSTAPSTGPLDASKDSALKLNEYLAQHFPGTVALERPDSVSNKLLG